MGEHSEQMRLIQSLDPSAHLSFSKFTDKWFMSARIEIAENGMLSGATEHRESVEDAINDYLDKLKQVGNTSETRFTQALKASPLGEPRYYTWNGAAFAECKRPE